jgi:hypothetical protein
VPSKCCALIDAHITIRFFAYDDSLYTSEQIDLTGVGLD